MAGSYIIIGLGNPGPEYRNTRHNLGFMVLDHLALDWQVAWKKNKKANFHYLEHEAFVLVKPQTFMNLSGKVLAPVQKKWQAAKYLLTVVDNLDLEPGRIRFKNGGGDSGHNGLRSIINHLGTRDFLRLYIGIGHPGNREAVLNYVLNRVPRSEEDLIAASIRKSCAAIELMPKRELTDIFNDFNRQ